MILHDLKKGWPLIVLGLIAAMCLIRGCSIIMSPPAYEVRAEEGIRHLVFLKLKPDVNKDQVILEIKKIKAIDGLRDLEVGLFKDLGDVRALSDYDIAFSMNFEGEEDYQKYQQDSVHLQLKESLKDLLAGSPATYDFELK